MNRKTDEWEPHMSATDYAVMKVTGPILSTDAAWWLSGYARAAQYDRDNRFFDADRRASSCRLIHAASGCVFSPGDIIPTTESRSGLSITAPIGVQLRVLPDHRAGLHSRAFAYSA